MDNISVTEIRDYIKTNKKPSYLSTNKKEIRVRCPYCGDSIKNKNHAHLYIELAAPFFFYCQRCQMTGVLNTEVLSDLGLYSSDISVGIKKLNKHFKGKFKPKKQWNFKSNIKLPSNDRDTDLFKYDYFNQRFGLSLDRKEIDDTYKVVTDFSAFKKVNYLNFDDFKNQIYNNLDNDYIGYLSTDGSHIVSRDVKGIHAKRYHNFKIDDNDPFGKKFYTIKTKVDLMSETLNLVITEGIFDIVGVFNHIYNGNKNNTNTVFAAACGKGFSQVVEHFMNLGFLDINIDIYSDRDLHISFFKKLKNNNLYMRDKKITVHYNTLDKDYGVTKDKISIESIRL